MTRFQAETENRKQTTEAAFREIIAAEKKKHELKTARLKALRLGSEPPSDPKLTKKKKARKRPA